MLHRLIFAILLACLGNSPAAMAAPCHDAPAQIAVHDGGDHSAPASQSDQDSAAMGVHGCIGCAIPQTAGFAAPAVLIGAAPVAASPAAEWPVSANGPDTPPPRS